MNHNTKSQSKVCTMNALSFRCVTHSDLMLCLKEVFEARLNYSHHVNVK